MNRDKKLHGFTLIELMLAMGFVSALLVVIAMTVIQIGGIYNKGLTLKDVNQAGRSLASELQRSISQSFSFDLASHYVVQGGATPYGGRLCLGQYSYIWNYGDAVKINNPARLNKYAAPNADIKFSFVKIIDPNAHYCLSPSTAIDSAGAIELANVGEHDFAIHNFTVSTVGSASDPKTGQRLYSISFLIGTNDQTALTGSLGATRCLIPNEIIINKTPDPTYCFVSQFDIVARSGNVVQ